MDSIVINAFAKINLFLEVNEKLPDGYHDLQSIMQSVSLHDRIKFVKRSDGKFTLNCPGLDTDIKDNLIYKAAERFFEGSGIEFSGIDITVEKNIPICAGLAGGSTDAAATLKALNTLYGEPFSIDELMKIGRKIGADVPFCIMGGTALAEGIGEKLTRVNNMPNCHILIAIGDTGVSTKWAFEELDKKQKRKTAHPNNIINKLNIGDLKGICDELYNVFETVSPFDGEIKNIMELYSPSGVLMSGSGPSVFSVFNDEENAKKAKTHLLERGYRAFICTPVNN